MSVSQKIGFVKNPLNPLFNRLSSSLLVLICAGMTAPDLVFHSDGSSCGISHVHALRRCLTDQGAFSTLPLCFGQAVTLDTCDQSVLDPDWSGATVANSYKHREALFSMLVSDLWLVKRSFYMFPGNRLLLHFVCGDDTATCASL